jgi:hypothetical protein
MQAMNAIETQRMRGNLPKRFNPDKYNFDYMSEFDGKDELVKAWLMGSDTVGSTVS